MPGTFFPAPTSKETACSRSRHASRNVRHARAMMHVEIANPRWGENVPGIPGAWATRNFTSLLHQLRPTNSVDINTRLQPSDPSSIPAMHGGFLLIHHSGVIMSPMASQITSLTIAYSTIYSVADQSKHQSSASLAFVRGIHRWPWNSLHKGPVTRKKFSFDDIIMMTCFMIIWVLPCLDATVSNRWSKLYERAASKDLKIYVSIFFDKRYNGKQESDMWWITVQGHNKGHIALCTNIEFHMRK